MKTKTRKDYAVKRSFSAPGRLLTAAEAKAVAFGFAGLSDYIQSLLRADLQGKRGRAA